MTDSESPQIDPADELAHYIVTNEVRDPKVMTDLLLTHGGSLRRVLRSVLEAPEFIAANDDKATIERYHSVSQYLLARDAKLFPEIPEEKSPLESFLEARTDSASKNSWLSEL